ncbi:MAG: alpha/beta hydrolase [Solirubrobacterales bacterium]|nr:alpha/beta hydrolase [Solirubrobacterales bacterium]
MTSDNARPKQAVLVLSGIGLTAGVAARTIASLRPHFEIVAAPQDRAVTTADEALALLDRAKTDRAHVLGLSFGASVAQEVAIRHPERVRSLVLGSSTAGGRLYVPPSRATRQFVRRLADLPAEEGLWAAVPYLYADTTCRGCAPLIGEDIAERLAGRLDPHAYRRQHAIARAHNIAERAHEITAPTLVIHGEHDRVLPRENGRQLAGAIPGAEFIEVSAGAHAFPTDVLGANQEIVRFLRAHTQRRRATPTPKSSPTARTSRATPA